MVAQDEKTPAGRATESLKGTPRDRLYNGSWGGHRVIGLPCYGCHTAPQETPWGLCRHCDRLADQLED